MLNYKEPSLLVLCFLFVFLAVPAMNSWSAPAPASPSTASQSGISPLLIPLLTFLGGGFMGALVTLYVTAKRQQTQVSLELIDGFFSKYQQLAEVKSLLENPLSLKDPHQLNRVREMGDWFDMIALFCEKKYADKKLLVEVGLIDQVVTFRKTVERTGSQLGDLLKIWKSMQRLS